MDKHTRTWLALLLAGMISTSVACGDDNGGDDGDNSSNGSSGNDSSENGSSGNGSSENGSSENGSSGNGSSENGSSGDNGTDGACPEHPNVTDIEGACEIKGTITEDLTLAPIEGKAGYLLSGGVFVGEDVGGDEEPDSSARTATLTIEPGTVLVGKDSLSFLAIERGSKIMAEGEADNPILFTSNQPEPGPGDWGGLVINGRAPHNQGTQVEGEAGTGYYAGPDESDNSGVLKYVRVEFGGGKVDNQNELNGIAFQGVGSGTEVDYIHVHANDDDGVEFFGGTVNAKHLIITGVSDDSIDWTSGWTGKLQYALVVQQTDQPTSDPNGIEADNDEDNPTADPISAPMISNLTLIGEEGVTNSFGMKLRRGTQAVFYNTLVVGFNDACLVVDGAESAGYAGEELAMTNSRIYCETLYAEGTDNAAQTMFEADESNEVLESADVLEDNYAPKADSGLLGAGETPDDAFFDEVDFIGAIGDEDWTEGAWFKLPE